MLELLRLHLLAERVSQAGEPAHGHPHGQVLPLNQAGRDMVLVAVAGGHNTLGGKDTRRTVVIAASAILEELTRINAHAPARQ